MSRECPERRVELFDPPPLSDLVDLTDGNRSRECSNSRVSDSMVLAGLAKSELSKVVLEADFYKNKSVTVVLARQPAGHTLMANAAALFFFLRLGGATGASSLEA
jgi:hypothetical protein